MLILQPTEAAVARLQGRFGKVDDHDERCEPEQPKAQERGFGEVVYDSRTKKSEPDALNPILRSPRSEPVAISNEEDESEDQPDDSAIEI